MKNQDEINLVKFFTRNKSLTRVQKARFESLLARDCSKDRGSNIKSGIRKDCPKKNRQYSKSDIEYRSPQALQNFLKNYNQNPILKYTCHKIDSPEAINFICKKCGSNEYNYDMHRTLVTKAFDDLLSNCKELVSENMIALMSAYLKGGQKWSSNEIVINWSHDSIRNWANENPTKIPNPGENIQNKQRHEGFVLPTSAIFISKLTKERIKDFGQLCIHFKNLFHIRFDNSLWMLIEKNFSEYLIDKNQNKKRQVVLSFSPNKFYKNIELFTDVDKLIQAIRGIIDICSKCAKEIKQIPKIEIEFYQENEYIILTIHHINSQYQKSSKDACERIGEEQTALITNRINGLADLYIEADFGNNEYGMINLWDGNDVVFSPRSEVIGVKYILKF